jgi:hypothetical protein
MKTIDSLLHFVFLEAMTTPLPFSSRDSRTLQSLHNAMQTDTYITEKQGNLLLQILSNDLYAPFMLLANSDYAEYINDPLWKKDFRILPDVKKIYHIPAGSNQINIHLLKENYTGVIAIDFTFSTTIRNELKPLVDILWQVKSGSLYYADFNEANLVAIIEKLQPYNFEIEPILQDYYDTITTWDKLDIAEMYNLNTITYPRFQDCIAADVGDITNLSPAIINDRRLRYQYTTKLDDIQTEYELTKHIANREKTKVWVDSNLHSIDAVIKSLIELKRFPLLVVFDQSTDLITITQFNELAHALESNGITDNIGFHFRLDNTPDGKIFNDAIGKRKYNSVLNTNTQVAAVLGGKLPKFFLKEKWQPMSVLCIKNTLRHSKTAVYANRCDLVISYVPVEPIIETRNKWESN